jgi:hypothetical protein
VRALSLLDTPTYVDRVQVAIDALERVTDKRVRATGPDKWVARCPCPNHGKGRGDRNPSLGLLRMRDGNPFFTCFAGCEYKDILAALSLEWHDIRGGPKLGPNVVHGPKGEIPEDDELDVGHPFRRAFAVPRAITAHAFSGPDSAFPSQQRIANLLGTHRRYVSRDCAWLRETGWLSWHHERSPGRPWAHNVYELHCTWVRPYRKRVLAWFRRCSAYYSYRVATVAISEIHPTPEGRKQYRENPDPVTASMWEARAGP